MIDATLKLCVVYALTKFYSVIRNVSLYLQDQNIFVMAYYYEQNYRYLISRSLFYLV